MNACSNQSLDRPTVEPLRLVPKGVALLDTYTSRQACEVLAVTRHGLHHMVVVGKVCQIRFPDEQYPRYLRADVDGLATQRQLTHEGLYTAKESRERLGNMAPMTFYAQVKAGKIRTAPMPVTGTASSSRAGTKGYVIEDVEALARIYTNQFDREVAHPDPDAYQELYVRLAAPRVSDEGKVLPSRSAVFMAWRFAFPLQEAEDIVQETFMDLWEHGAAFFVDFVLLEQQILGMHKRLRTAAFNYMSKQQARLRVEDELQGLAVSWCKPRVPTVEEQAIVREQIADVFRYCHLLPSEQQMIAKLAIAGYTVEEIGAYLRQEGIVSYSDRTMTRKRATVMDQICDQMSWVLEAA